MNIQGKYRIKVHNLKTSCIIEIYATFMSCRTLIFFLSMFFLTPTKCVFRTSSLSHSSGRNDKSLSFIGHGMLLTHHAYCFIIESNQETHFLVNIYQKTLELGLISRLRMNSRTLRPRRYIISQD